MLQASLMLAAPLLNQSLNRTVTPWIIYEIYSPIKLYILCVSLQIPKHVAITNTALRSMISSVFLEYLQSFSLHFLATFDILYLYAVQINLITSIRTHAVRTADM